MKSNAYIVEYWETQPSVLLRMISESKELTKSFVELYCKIKPTHLYLVGSGTSLNAEEAATSLLTEILGVNINFMPSSYLHKIQGERPLIVFLSQGGSSTNTLKAMEQLKEYPYITVTGEQMCEIASRSKCHMVIGCGEEAVGPKTVGYTSSVMVLYLMALEAALATEQITENKYIETKENLVKGLSCMRYNMESVVSWMNQYGKEIKDIKKYIFIAHGTGALALKEGCLKILETIKYPAFSYEFEEYLHGPILAADKETGVFLFPTGEKEEQERFKKLAMCQEKYTPYTYDVTDKEERMTEKIIHIQRTGKAYTEVFENIVIPQYIAATIQGILGIEDGSPLYDEYTAICPTKYNNGK